ncbi:hypothetical protein AHAS_Ahas03G0262900 [Arachis hypogaea]
MVRKGVIQAITMLMIGIIICSANAEFHYTAVESPWTKMSYHITSSKLRECLAKCEKMYANDTIKVKSCKKQCRLNHCLAECRSRYANNEPEK